MSFTTLRLAGRLALAFSLLVLLSSVAYSQTDLCLAQAAGFGGGGNACTANDISIKEIVVGQVLDGCTSSTDTASVEMTARVEVSGGGSKYDIGIFLNVSGGSAFSGINECFRDFFDPGAAVTEGENLDSDACHDVVGSNTYPPNLLPGIADAILGPITIACNDDGTAPNGVVDFSGCVSYVQAANSTICSGVDDAFPLNTSKCGCGTQEVPGLSLPELTLTKSCDSATLTPGSTSQCTITYTNSSSLSAADFMTFLDDYDESVVEIVSIDSTTGTDVAVDSAGIITLTPTGAVAAGNIEATPAAGATGTMVYTIRLIDPLPGGVMVGDPIVNTVCAYWSGIEQTLCDTFTHNVGPTAAVISAFSVTEASDGVAVQWQTAAETGTQGFQLERWDDVVGEFVAAGPAIATIESAPQGSDYRVIDLLGTPDSKYRVVELEVGGRSKVHDTDNVAPITRARRGAGLTVLGMPAGRQRAIRRPAGSGRSANSDGLVAAQLAGKAVRAGMASVSQRLVLEVAQTGLQSVEASILADSFGLRRNQLDSRFKSGRLFLSKDGENVDWWVSASGDRLFFYGVYEDNLFSLTAPYRLDLARGSTASAENVEAGQGSLIDQVSASRVLEQNNLSRVGLVENASDDFWFWALVLRNGTSSLDMDVASPATAATAQLTVNYFGVLVDPGAAISVAVNGTAIGSAVISGDGARSATFSVPANGLVTGINDVAVSVNGQVGGIAVDTLRLEFIQNLVGTNGAIAFSLDQAAGVRIAGLDPSSTQLLDVTDPNRPIRLFPQKGGNSSLFTAQLSAGNFLAVDQASEPTIRPYSLSLNHVVQPADQLIVTHASLLSGGEAYADYRRAQGLRVTVMTAQQASDLYTDSRPEPDAIRLLTQAVAKASAGDLKGLFLIGIGKSDHRDLLGFGGNLVPAALLKVSFGLVASDRLFVDFDADGEDEVAVGRLPAYTNQQVFDYLDKVQGYESHDGTWRQRDLLLADNADSAGNFSMDSDNYVAPLLRNPQRVYLGQTHNTTAARSALVDSWEDGLRLINYFGHGGGPQLAVEDLLQVSALDALAGVESNPVFLALTCNIGRFDFPGFDGLAADLVLSTNGAAAVWASAGLSVQTSARVLAASFLEALNSQPGLAVGEAARGALNQQGSSGAESLMTLLGDPLLISQ